MDDVDVDWGLDDDGYDDDCLSVGGDDEELADDTKTNPMKPQEVALTEEAKRNGERRSEQRGTENNEEKYLEDREEKLEKHVEESSTTKEMRPEGKPESMSNPTSSKTASNPAAVQTPRSYQQAVSPPPPKSKASSPPQRSILSVRDRRAPSHETSPHGLQAESRDGPRRQEPRNDSHRESDRRGGKARPVDERHDKARMDDKTRRTGWEPDERREVRLERHRAAWREDEVRSLRSSDDGYHLKGAFQQPLHNSTDGLPEGWRRIVPEKAFREGIPIPVAPQGGPGPFFYRHEETGVGQWEKPMGKSVDKPTEQVHEPNPTDQTGHVDRSKDNRRNGSEEPKSVSKQNDPQERDHNRPTGHVATSATYFPSSGAPTGPRAARDRERPPRTDYAPRASRVAHHERDLPNPERREPYPETRDDGGRSYRRVDRERDRRDGHREHERREDRSEDAHVHDKRREVESSREPRRDERVRHDGSRDEDRPPRRHDDGRSRQHDPQPAPAPVAVGGATAAGPRMNEGRAALLEASASGRALQAGRTFEPRPTDFGRSRFPPETRPPARAGRFGLPPPIPPGPVAGRGMRAWGPPERRQGAPLMRDTAPAPRNMASRDGPVHNTTPSGASRSDIAHRDTAPHNAATRDTARIAPRFSQDQERGRNSLDSRFPDTRGTQRHSQDQPPESRREDPPKPREEPRRSEQAEALRAQVEKSRRSNERHGDWSATRRDSDERKELRDTSGEKRKRGPTDEDGRRPANDRSTDRLDERREPTDGRGDRLVSDRSDIARGPARGPASAVPIHPSRMGLVPAARPLAPPAPVRPEPRHEVSVERPRDLASRISDRPPRDDKPYLASRMSVASERVEEKCDHSWKSRSRLEPPTTQQPPEHAPRPLPDAERSSRDLSSARPSARTGAQITRSPDRERPFLVHPTRDALAPRPGPPVHPARAALVPSEPVLPPRGPPLDTQGFNGDRNRERDEQRDTGRDAPAYGPGARGPRGAPDDRDRRDPERGEHGRSPVRDAPAYGPNARRGAPPTGPSGWGNGRARSPPAPFDRRDDSDRGTKRPLESGAGNGREKRRSPRRRW